MLKTAGVQKYTQLTIYNKYIGLPTRKITHLLPNYGKMVKNTQKSIVQFARISIAEKILRNFARISISAEVFETFPEQKSRISTKNPLIVK